MKSDVPSKPSRAAVKHTATNVQPVPERKLENGVIGGIIGDVCASVYTPNNRNMDVPRFAKLIDARSVFTGATVLSVANMEACLGVRVGGTVSHNDFIETYDKYIRKWSSVEFNRQLRRGCRKGDLDVYYDMGTDNATRVGPIGWLPVSDINIVRSIARGTGCWWNSTYDMVTQSIAAAVYLARDSKSSKNDLKSYLETTFGYNLSCALDTIGLADHIDIRGETAVQMGLVAFLESNSFEDAIRRAIKGGRIFNLRYGDSFSINISQVACITGTVAGAYYKDVSEDLLQFACYKILSLSDTIKSFVSQAGMHTDLPRFFDFAMEHHEELGSLYGPRQD